MATTSSASSRNPIQTHTRSGSAPKTTFSSSPPTSNPVNGSTKLSHARATPPRPVGAIGSLPARRNTVKAGSVSGQSMQEVSEALALALKDETEAKEKLLLQTQEKDALIDSLLSEKATLQSSLGAAQAAVNDMFVEQARSEEEIATRLELTEKLRIQVRDLEKEKREIHRRYNDQTAAFEAERQNYYDNEQHLKSRIQSLSQARKRAPSPPRDTTDDAHVVVDEFHDEDKLNSAEDVQNERPAAPILADVESPEMIALRLEFSTLTTSYASLQASLAHLQSQLGDLKRVNNELQEENESYMILLRERTLNGQFDVMRQVGTNNTFGEETSEDEFYEYDENRSIHSVSSRGVLDVVTEEESESFDDEELERQLDRSASRTPEFGSSPEPEATRKRPSHRRRGSASSSGSQPLGESLAGLPITGPGLDLAAELGRAENQGALVDTFDDRDRNAGSRKRDKRSSRRFDPFERDPAVAKLQSEVKNLKDANKALSLYASKIIDRIISQEGFEHVLAVDFNDKQPTPTAKQFNPPLTVSAPDPPQSTKKARPQSVMVTRTPSSSSTSDAKASPSIPASPKAVPDPKKSNRRSFSMDWSSFSLFGSDKKPEPAGLRPLTLKPGSISVTGLASPGLPSPSIGRKHDTEEDENDRRERERLHATMKLMGINPPPKSSAPPSPTPPSPVKIPSPPIATVTSPPATATTSRFSWFRSNTASSSSDLTSSPAASLKGNDSSVALHDDDAAAEVVSTKLASLTAQEATLISDIAKGGNGGFTETPRRSASLRRQKRNSRISGGGSSGTTVFSAGLEDDP